MCRAAPALLRTFISVPVSIIWRLAGCVCCDQDVTRNRGANDPECLHGCHRASARPCAGQNVTAVGRGGRSVVCGEHGRGGFGGLECPYLLASNLHRSRNVLHLRRWQFAYRCGGLHCAKICGGRSGFGTRCTSQERTDKVIPATLAAGGNLGILFLLPSGVLVANVCAGASQLD